MNNAKIEADKLRDEAKQLLGILLPEGHREDLANRLIDCIVFATMLEIASINMEVAGK